MTMVREATLHTSESELFTQRTLKHAHTYPTWVLSRYGSTENILHKDLLPLIRTILKNKKKRTNNKQTKCRRKLKSKTTLQQLSIHGIHSSYLFTHARHLPKQMAFCSPCKKQPQLGSKLLPSLAQMPREMQQGLGGKGNTRFFALEPIHTRWSRGHQAWGGWCWADSHVACEPLVSVPQQPPPPLHAIAGFRSAGHMLVSENNYVIKSSPNLGYKDTTADSFARGSYAIRTT